MKNDVWKFVLIGVGVLALGFTLVRFVFGGDAVPQNEYRLYADVVDGTLYRFKQRGRTLMTPMPNPENPDRLSLFPVERDEDGAFVIPALNRPDPANFVHFGFERAPALVDLETGLVEVTNEDPLTAE